jgi:hypothetical protein
MPEPVFLVKRKERGREDPTGGRLPKVEVGRRTEKYVLAFHDEVSSSSLLSNTPPPPSLA